ncbi:hypothetical protein HanXRQr2_Chr16g0727121 [Helianthus annuus]|uniref:Uncharacterized protein n=1 Tax=Helianthus annuus TaxID=4232 RepID=A0A9K3DMW8_HELAN|nr:hypothetical protein HanXRQr2_Chr16g0727121 [Helianthus annuus]
MASSKNDIQVQFSRFTETEVDQFCLDHGIGPLLGSVAPGDRTANKCPDGHNNSNNKKKYRWGLIFERYFDIRLFQSSIIVEQFCCKTTLKNKDYFYNLIPRF